MAKPLPSALFPTISHSKKRALLLAYAETGRLREACRAASRLIGLEGHEDAHLGPEDEHTFKKDIEAFQYRLKDYIRVEGATIKELTGTTASPRDHFDVLIDLIAGTTGIPKRILTGSEREELASTQDQEAWRQRISRRQTTFAEQSMLRPLIDRLVLLRALPTPAQPYTVVWENLLALRGYPETGIGKRVDLLDS